MATGWFTGSAPLVGFGLVPATLLVNLRLRQGQLHPIRRPDTH